MQAIPDSALRRVAVFITNDSQNSAPALVKSADLLTDVMSERIRKILGAKPGELPMGEPTLSRLILSGGLLVTVHRDGTFSPAQKPDSSTNDTTGGSRLLYQALVEASNDGERVFWPEAAEGDSATFRIVYYAPNPARDGTPSKAPIRFAAAVFTMGLPWEDPPSVISMPRPSYPSDSRAGGVEGYLLLRFVVDENGVADPATLHDAWPPNLAPPTGLLKGYYQQFVNAARTAALKAKFKPAIVAGCPIRRLVQLPFDLQIAH